MQCPFCKSQLSKVIDKRAVNGSGEIRRRRECLKCHERFTTYERVAQIEFTVIKKDGRREIFDKAKLRSGIARALEKRPAFESVDEITAKIENKLRLSKTKEVTSKFIGNAVLSELKRVDKIAFLRFTSVYKKFENPGDFAKVLTSLENK